MFTTDNNLINTWNQFQTLTYVLAYLNLATLPSPAVPVKKVSLSPHVTSEETEAQRILLSSVTQLISFAKIRTLPFPFC